MSVTEGEWMSVTDAAKYIGASRPTLYRYAKLGYVPSYEDPAGRKRFRRTELDEIFKALHG
jgi:excisionase family DNA binding protein